MPGIGQVGVGTAAIGGITVLTAATHGASASSTPATLTAEYEASPVSHGATATSEAIPPVILEPRNLTVYYDEQASEFRSEWFPKRVPDDGERCVCLTAAFRANSSPDAFEVIVERDDTGDGQPDGQTRRLEVAPQTGITLLTESNTDFEFADDARYRVRFPSYAQPDVVTQFHLALAIDSRQRLKDAWPLAAVDTADPAVTDLLNVLGTSLTRETARIDETYDEHFVGTASGQRLEAHAEEVGLNRRGGETDRELRIRVQVAKVAATTSTTLDEFARALQVIFGSAAQTATVDAVAGEAAVEVTIPEAALEATPLGAGTVENLLQSTTSIGEGVRVRVEGSFSFGGEEGTGFGSGSLSRRIID